MAAENKSALPLGVSRYLGHFFAIWCIAFMAAENKSVLPLVFLGSWGNVLRFGALPSLLLKKRVRYLWVGGLVLWGN